MAVDNSAWKPRSIEYTRESVKVNLDEQKTECKPYEVQKGDTYYRLADTYKQQTGTKTDLNTLIQKMQDQTGQDAGHLSIGKKIDFSSLEDKPAVEDKKAETEKETKADAKDKTFTGDAAKDGKNYVSVDKPAEETRKAETTNAETDEATAASTESDQTEDVESDENTTASTSDAEDTVDDTSDSGVFRPVKTTKAVYKTTTNQNGFTRTTGSNGYKGAMVESGNNAAGASTDADGNANVAAKNERGETAEGDITENGATVQAFINKSAASGSVTHDGKTVKIHGETKDGNGAAATVTENGVDTETTFKGRNNGQLIRDGYTVNINGDAKGTTEKRIVTHPDGSVDDDRTVTISKGSGYDTIAQNKVLMGQISRLSQDKQRNTFDTGIDADDLKALRAANPDAWKGVTDAQIADFINTSSDRTFNWFGPDVSADDLKRTQEEYGLYKQPTETGKTDEKKSAEKA